MTRSSVVPVMFPRPISCLRGVERYTALGIARLLLSDDDLDTSDGSGMLKGEIIVINSQGEMFTIAAVELEFQLNIAS
jgi:hypothetical protein